VVLVVVAAEALLAQLVRRVKVMLVVLHLELLLLVVAAVEKFLLVQLLMGETAELI
jgi:hypothetical protein